MNFYNVCKDCEDKVYGCCELFEDNYVRGKYGAVPYLNFFEELTDKLSQYENEK